MFVRWLYASRSLLGAEQASAEIASILVVSVPRNASLDVTGALLFTGERFAQCLEGPERAVAQLRASICRDSRHEAVVTILEEAIDERLFQGWSLAYTGLSRFVQGEVDRAVNSWRHSWARAADQLVKMMQAFAEGGPHYLGSSCTVISPGGE